MNITLTLPESLHAWAASQTDIEIAIIFALEEVVAKGALPYEIAASKLRNTVKKMPTEIQFTIQDMIGLDIWTILKKEDRLALGRIVKANACSFGIICLGKNSGNHAIYNRCHAASEKCAGNSRCAKYDGTV